MCGRYTLKPDPAIMAAHFGLADLPSDMIGEGPDGGGSLGLPLSLAPALRPRYNISPSQDVPVIKAGEPHMLSMMIWGLVPFWSKEPKVNISNINARVETVAASPAYRNSFKMRRCLMPADGFYEWRVEPPSTRPGSGNGNAAHVGGGKSHKTPYHFRLKDQEDGGLFAFAGIWDRWEHRGGRNGNAPLPSDKPPPAPFESCALITTTPNEVVNVAHDRMPAILLREDYGHWLDTKAKPDDLLALLKPIPAELMEGFAVGQRVNRPGNEGPGCAERT